MIAHRLDEKFFTASVWFLGNTENSITAKCMRVEWWASTIKLSVVIYWQMIVMQSWAPFRNHYAMNI